MLVPISWLNDYVDLKDIDLKEFCDKMVMSGSNIEETYQVGKGIKGVVVGKILSMEKHPDADHLSVVKVDVGSRTLQIITGAPNVKKDALVAVILSGETLPDGKKIEKGMLRGLESDGMLCSFQELGYEDKVVPVADKDGIILLGEDYPLGQELSQALDTCQDVVDFEITPNRPDCLCMTGMAREAAAVFERTLSLPRPVIQREEGDVKDYVSVEIKRPELCSRYVARVVRDVKVERSPWWMQNRLICAGMRPINNVVDITNYVMLELGTPIHAFDLGMVKGSRIIVDVAKEGEAFTTLDGAERTLDEKSLLINDTQRGIALAGIMGGLNSEIEQDTAAILVEAACFDPDGTRRTSKKLGLRTEASARFEKGVDPNLCRLAADRVCQLIEELGAGIVVGGAVDVYPREYQAPTVAIRPGRISDLLGVALSGEEITGILTRLGMKVTSQKQTLLVTPPTVRMDLPQEVDYVEEVARIYGYDRLPATLPKGSNAGVKTQQREREDLIRDTLLALGLNEIQTYSFVSPKGVDKILCPPSCPERGFVRLINPLGEENSVMRTTLIPNMLEVLERNYTRNIPQAEAFELGRVFLNDIKTEEGLPAEPKKVCIGMYGAKEDFYALKGVCEGLFKELRILDVEFVQETENKTFHPGRCAVMKKGERVLGTLGEISIGAAEQYNLPQRVYVCEMDVNALSELADLEIRYKAIPKYPAIQRDIAVVVADQVQAGQVEGLIRSHGGPLLERVSLFDVYKGKQVQEGCKSLAFSLVYRNPEKTLTDGEISEDHQRILKALEEDLGATLRDM